MSGLALKLIAVTAMLIDHLGVVLGNLGILTGVPYTVFRGIGRIAFPIFAFLLAEGAKHTEHKVKYLIRMGILALLSEVPFDLTSKGVFFYPAAQNVFVTLLLGLLAVYVIRWAGGVVGKMQFPAFLAALAAAAAAALLNAKLLKGDYHAAGIICIAVMGIYSAPLYKLRFRMMNQEGVLRLLFGGVAIMLLALMTNEIEYFALFALIPIYFYNGKRGYRSRVLQWAFYFFYPAHLLVLGLIQYFIMWR